MKISLLEPLGVSEEQIWELAEPVRRAGHEFVYFDEKTTDLDELAKRSADSDVVMIANNPYPDQVVRRASKLRMIDVAFTGIDHVGTAACRERGIAICNAANYSNQAVAELTIGLTIGLMRKIDSGDAAVRAHQTSAGLTGREICGKTVGVVGTGRIGSIVARLFQAFGARVVAYSRTEREDLKTAGIRYVSLEALMRESDIVTLHVPNNPQTKGMIHRGLIDRMKRNAILINCARGPVIDNQALADALNEDRIAGAGIDVFNCEPPIPKSEPLLAAKNTLLTPHVAFLTEESMQRRAKIVFENLYAYLGGTPVNVCAL